MITTIEQLIEKLNYDDYHGVRNGMHHFTHQYLRQKKKSHQWFQEITCELCGKPYFKRRYTNSKSHVWCANMLTCKTRKPRKRKVKNDND